MPSVQAQPYEFVFQPEHVALVIVDMQRDFVDPPSNIRYARDPRAPRARIA